MPDHSFAYLYERFPSFVQTFVYREAEEMLRQGMNPLLVSIRQPKDDAEVAVKCKGDVLYLPETQTLRATLELPRRVRWKVPRERRERDVNRLYEALWLAPELKRRGIRHVHAHFAGMAARTAWWLREIFGFTYSFTGHANDIFCDTDYPVSIEQLVRDAKFIVTETNYARDWLAKKYPRSVGKTSRVFNGIEAGQPFREVGVSWPKERPPRILSVGRAVEKKGFTHLIEACRILGQRGVAFTCQIVGGGPLEAALRTQIESAGLSDVVTQLGPRSQSEVRRLLAETRVFALACVPDAEGGSDNLPTVVLEAMAAGVPVVSTTIAGVPEMITHERDGLLVAPKDATALANALQRMLSDETFASACADHARGVVIENFSIEENTRALKHLLVTRALVSPPEAAIAFEPGMPRPSPLARLLAPFR